MNIFKTYIPMMAFIFFLSACSGSSTTSTPTNPERMSKNDIISFLVAANQDEINAVRTLDSSIMGRRFAGSQLNLIENHIKQLSDQGVYRVSELDGDQSFVHDINHVGTTTSIQTCEYWQSQFYTVDTNEFLEGYAWTAMPQTIHIEMINNQPYITRIDHTEKASFCPEISTPEMVTVIETPEPKSTCPHDVETIANQLRQVINRMAEGHVHYQLGGFMYKELRMVELIENDYRCEDEYYSYNLSALAVHAQTAQGIYETNICRNTEVMCSASCLIDYSWGSTSVAERREREAQCKNKCKRQYQACVKD